MAARRERWLARWRMLRARSGPEEPKTPVVRIGLVLSGGGLRGAGHIGVLEQLVAHDIPIDVIVGSSAGAIVGAYYAAVGLSVPEMVSDAATFRGRHLLAHSLAVRLRGGGRLQRACGVIPERLEQLEHATFDRLHHQVRAIGVVCHDLSTGRPCYFATGATGGVRLADAVRASASVPHLFPAVRVRGDQGVLSLTDGGISDCLPVEFARRLSATHLIVSDCRRAATRPRDAERVVYVRPSLRDTGMLRAPSSTLLVSVRDGAAAVTAEAIEVLRSWVQDLEGPDWAPAG